MFSILFFFFFFNATATTEIYTLSLHDALPICRRCLHGDVLPRSVVRDPGARPVRRRRADPPAQGSPRRGLRAGGRDRKSTRLNSSHQIISYAVFCLKKKKNAVKQ